MRSHDLSSITPHWFVVLYIKIIAYFYNVDPHIIAYFYRFVKLTSFIILLHYQSHTHPRCIRLCLQYLQRVCWQLYLVLYCNVSIMYLLLIFTILQINIVAVLLLSQTRRHLYKFEGAARFSCHICTCKIRLYSLAEAYKWSYFITKW